MADLIERPPFDEEQANLFFATLFDLSSGPVELRSLPGLGPARRHWTTPELAAGWARHFWDQGTEVRYGVSNRRQGGGTTRDVVCLPLFYADIDAITDETEELLYKYAPPTMIVSSGRGLHVYWKLIDPMDHEDLPIWLRIESTIVRRLNADKASKDAAKLLRIPGSFNFKRGKPVTIQQIFTDCVYTRQTMIRHFEVSERAIWDSRMHAEREEQELSATPTATGPREVGGDATPEPPADLLAILRAARWSWRWTGRVAVLQRCPGCDSERAITGGSEPEKAWINRSLVLQCWRTKCMFGPERCPGGADKATWWPFVEALDWAKKPA